MTGSTKARRYVSALLGIAMLVLLTSCGRSGETTANAVDDTAADAAAEAPRAMSAEGGDDADDAMMEQVETDDGAAASDAANSATATTSSDGVDALGGGGLSAAQTQAIDIGRDIIFTAEISVAVPDVAEAGTAAVEQISRFGGLVFGQQTTTDPMPRSVLTFKVQPADFQDALAALGSIGDVRNQTISTDDVTERVVDLESRISTAEASVQRLRGFLEGASDLDSIAALERQLLERETDLERLKGQLRTVKDRVDLATITLTLVQLRSAPSVSLSVSAYPGSDGGLSCPGGPEGLRVERDEPMTLCFDITNTGDTALSGFTLRDQALGIDSIDQLTKVFGAVDWIDGATMLAPDESVTLAFEHAPSYDARTLTQLSALPIDESGSSIDGQRVGDTRQFQIRAVDPGGVPSFSEGLAASWELLKSIGLVALLAVGVLLPFAWVIVVLLLGWRWFAARNEKRRQTAAAAQKEARETRKARDEAVLADHAAAASASATSAE